MSLMLPDSLEWVLDMLGFQWPTADEDKLFESAQVWRKFAAEVEELQVQSVRSAGNVLSTNYGESVDGFRSTWEKFSGGSGYLDDARQGAEMIAMTLEAAAVLVIGMKVAVIIQLSILAAQLIAAAAAAPFTLGLSSLGSMAATMLTREAVRRILREVAQQLLQAVLETLKEPFVSALQAMVSDIIAQTVNQNFGAQDGYDLGRTARTGYEEGRAAAAQSGQTFAESLRDGAGAHAGRRARDAMDSAAGGGSDSDGGGGSGSGPDSDSSSAGSNSSGNTSPSFPSASSSGAPLSTSSPFPSSNTGSHSSGGSEGNPDPSAATGPSALSSPSAPSNFSSPSNTDDPRAAPAHQQRPTDTRGQDYEDNPFDYPRDRGGDPPARGENVPDGNEPTTGDRGRPPAPTTTPDPRTIPDSTPAPDAPRPEAGPASDPAPAPIRPDADPRPDSAPIPDPEPTHQREPAPTSPDPRTAVAQSTPDPTPDSTTTPQPDTQSANDGTGSQRTPSVNVPHAATSSQTTQHSSPQQSQVPHQRDDADGPAFQIAGAATVPQPTVAHTSPDAASPPPTPPSNTPQNAGPMPLPPTPAPPTPAPQQTPPATTVPPRPTTPDPRIPDPRTTDPRTVDPRQGSTQPVPQFIPQPVPWPAPPQPAHRPKPETSAAESTPEAQPEQPDTMGPGVPLQDIRDGLQGGPDGLLTPDPADQQALRNAVPTDGSGNPQRFPDPFRGYVAVQNDGGPVVPGRGNNCADCTRSFMETWYGNPQVSAPRTPSTDPDGTPDTRSGERNGTDNIQRFTDADFRYSGDTRTGYDTIADELRQSGPGSAAAVLVTWPDGSAHVFNAVNHQGRVVWVDAQTNTVSDKPINTQAVHIWHVITDADRNPYDPAKPAPEQQIATGSDPGTHPVGPPQEQRREDGRQQERQEQPRPAERPGAGNPQPGPESHDIPGVSGVPADDAYPDPAAHDDAPASFDDVRNELRDGEGGLDDPDPRDQQALEDAFPRDADGNFQRHPDPFDRWSSLQNDGGVSRPGRDDNCADGSRAFLESWYGNPQVSAPRMQDGEWGERDGVDNLERYTGAEFRYAGDGPTAYQQVADDLRNAGHGSAAVICVDWSDGGSHVFNAVNHNGTVVFVDSQSDEVAARPINTDVEGVFYIPLDPDGYPLHPPAVEDTDSRTGTDTDAEPGGRRTPDAGPGRDADTAVPPGSVDTALSMVNRTSATPAALGDHAGRNGRDRIENALGATFTDHGNGPEAFNRLEDTLRDTGPGSRAVITTIDSTGRSHAWNAVNQDGRVTYIDAQTGRTGTAPLHNGDNGVFAIPLTPDGRPTPPDANRPAPTPPGHPGQPSPGASRPAGTSAGAPPVAGPHPDDSHPRLERETPRTLRSGLPPDESQRNLRESNPVFRLTDHGTVNRHLEAWARDGQLAHVLRVAAGDTGDARAHPDRPRTFTVEGLKKALPGFADLNRGEQMLVVSTLARLSLTFHQRYGVNANPVATGAQSEGAHQHRTKNAKARDFVAKVQNLRAGAAAAHMPDLSDRNYAVLEIEGPSGIEYVVDSSYPNKKGSGGKHSERHLADWMEAVRETHPDYKVSALYTEREPCGDKKGALGRERNCAAFLRETLAGTPVYYSTSYRADQDADGRRRDLRAEMHADRRTELGSGPLPKKVRNKINSDVWSAIPQTEAESDRDDEMVERVATVQDLWAAIGPQL